MLKLVLGCKNFVSLPSWIGENWSLHLFYEVCFFWGYTLTLWIHDRALVQKELRRIVDSAHPASLELLMGLWNVTKELFPRGITLVEFYLNWLKWFHFLMLMTGPLVILINCMRMSMFTVSFLAQLGKMFSFYLWCIWRYN